MANETPVRDGQIVLLKRNNEVAAVVLRNQRGIGEGLTDFSWYYRSDGKGSSQKGDPGVSNGTVSNAWRIAFSTFCVTWSSHSDGAGWVYFSAEPTEFRKGAAYAMCVTTQTNLAAIDANDPTWRYRTRPRINVKALIDSQIKK
jgi:hypothetical protein